MNPIRILTIFESNPEALFDDAVLEQMHVFRKEFAERTYASRSDRMHPDLQRWLRVANVWHLPCSPRVN
jgi:hypothetical protein